MRTVASEAVPAPLDLVAAGDDGLGRLTRYWYELAGAAGDVPQRGAFDPGRVPDLLPNLIIAEHLGDHDFLYRLMGTEVDRFSKGRYTGRRTSEIDGHGPGNRIHALYVATLQHRRPCAVVLPYVGGKSICKSVRQFAAPFRFNGSVRQLISLIELELRDDVLPAVVTPDQRRLL